MVSQYLLFALFALVALALAAGLVVVWRFWQSYARITPEDEQFEREVAALNENQANRLSDERLRRPIDTDTGWQIMVRRGLRDTRRRSSRRQTGPSPRRPPR